MYLGTPDGSAWIDYDVLNNQLTAYAPLGTKQPTVFVNGTPMAQISPGQPWAESVRWIQHSNKYVFTLNLGDTGVILDSVTVDTYTSPAVVTKGSGSVAPPPPPPPPPPPSGSGSSIAYDARTKTLSAYAPLGTKQPTVFVNGTPMAQINPGQNWTDSPPWIVPGNRYVFTLNLGDTGVVLASVTVDTTGEATSTGPGPDGGEGGEGGDSFFSQDSLGFGLSNLMYLAIVGGGIFLFKRKS